MRPTSVSVTGVAASLWMPLNHATNSFTVGVYVYPGAGATVTVQITSDDVFNPAVTPVVLETGLAALTGAIVNTVVSLGIPAMAIRLNQTVGATLSKLTVVLPGGT